MRNPTRRSRKIGLTKGGRVRHGRAFEKASRTFPSSRWRDLSAATGPIQVIVENPSREYFHPCDAEEYLALLQQFPPNLARGVRAIVLRRTPRRDERTGVEARLNSSCIILNSFPRNRKLYWMYRPTSGERQHYAPWCDSWRKSRGVWVLSWTLDQIRRYYLYHLFTHELGHIHDSTRTSKRQSEAFAENFALEWARRFGVLQEVE